MRGTDPEGRSIWRRASTTFPAARRSAPSSGWASRWNGIDSTSVSVVRRMGGVIAQPRHGTHTHATLTPPTRNPTKCQPHASHTPPTRNPTKCQPHATLTQPTRNPTKCQPHASHTPATCQPHAHTSTPPTCHPPARRHNTTPAPHQPHTNHTSTTHQPHTNPTSATHQPHKPSATHAAHTHAPSGAARAAGGARTECLCLVAYRQQRHHNGAG